MPCLPAPGEQAHAFPMFAVTAADAAAIQSVFSEEGELDGTATPRRSRSVQLEEFNVSALQRSASDQAVTE